MTFLKQIAVLAAGLMLFAANGRASADVVVVMSSRSKVSSLSNNEINDIFLGRTSYLPNGDPVIAVDQSEDSGQRDEFYFKYMNKSPAQIKAHWSKLIFTGKGQPPKEISHIENLKKLMAANPNYIGYIERNEVDSNLKIISVAK
jgi:ABC-type phosphate transport system substrate-binding protein